MLAQARYLADFAKFVANKGRQERHDLQALAELETRGLELPSGLTVDWLGVSGYRMSYEGHDLYIDPYISRAPLSAVLARRPALPDPALLDRHVPRPGIAAVGVLIGHTHFDHAIDAPAIARRLGCSAYGSRSLQTLMALHGARDQAVVVTPYERYELGPFLVSFTPSVHSKLLLGLAVPMAGELTCDHLDALNPGAYKCGDVYGIRIEVAGTSFYHQGSSNLIDDAIRDAPVDVFLAGVAGRGFTDNYWRRVITRLQPQTIVPTHYDDFFRPIDADLGLTTNVNLARVPEEIAGISRDIAVTALPIARVSG
jgi:L-ascorbate metabolism protein UlaG (beta-lactamase superfamily)